MQFRTQISIPKSHNAINYDSKIGFLGSCFSERIADKMSYFGFQTKTNPLGVIFNPISIEKIMERCVCKKYFTEQDVFFYNDFWHCYEVHSELSNPNKEVLLNQLNLLVDDFYQWITESTHFQITYGTAWVYTHLATNQLVANCHKVPQKQFEKKILSISEIIESINRTALCIQKVQPNIHIVFTLSPVRHLKDGFVENQRSKAHLITALHEVVQTHNPSSETSTLVSYFPSYEIMMDELRDYRFYAEDMIHPNTIAVNYIWDLFTSYIMDDVTLKQMKEVEAFQRMNAHRPIHANSENHQLFLQKVALKKNELIKKIPKINL